MTHSGTLAGLGHCRSVLQRKAGVKTTAWGGWKYCFCRNSGTRRHFVYLCWNSFQWIVNLLQCNMNYPGVFLPPADVLCWWHLEDILQFGKVTMSKSDTWQQTAVMVGFSLSLFAGDKSLLVLGCCFQIHWRSMYTVNYGWLLSSFYVMSS